MPEVTALNHVLIVLNFSAKLCVFAFQIRCSELAANGFVFRKLLLQAGDFFLELCNQPVCSVKSLLQFGFLFLGCNVLLCRYCQRFVALGFPEKSADVRLAQYENGSRTPKADVTAALAKVLDVSPKALDVPDIDSYTGLMHTLFTLEDRYGLEVCECEDEVHLRVHIHKGRDAAELHRMLSAWGALAAKLKAGEITKEEYDRWRYYYPEYDTSGQWHKITPSQELSDLLLADLKEHSEE